MKYYVKTNCVNCGKEIEKYKFNKGNSFCKRPSYCRYEYLHKQRDPKGSAIMDNINDPDFYYLLGLICTDGNITYPRNGKKQIGYTCYINLNVQDIELVENIELKYGGTSQPMHDNTIRWWISNKHFIDYLISIGLTHNKTTSLNIESWFSTLTRENKIHFLRGVIDGDGSIKTYKKDKSFNICSGAKDFYNTIRKFLITITPTGITEDFHDTFSYIKYNNINMLTILDLVYDNINDKLHMKRKYDEYMKHKNFYASYDAKKDFRYGQPTGKK